MKQKMKRKLNRFLLVALLVVFIPTGMNEVEAAAKKTMSLSVKTTKYERTKTQTKKNKKTQTIELCS